MKIGILEAGLVPDELVSKHISYVAMVEDLLAKSHLSEGFSYTGYSVLNNVFPDDVQDCDGWVITGSRHGVYDNLPWMPPLKRFIQAISQAKVPLIGICFGHQIIAEALGGKVVKSDKGWGLGIHHYQASISPWLPLADTTLKLNAIHQDQVVEQPPNSTVIASSEFCPMAGLLYDAPILTFQGHPEFSIAYEADLISLRKGSSFPEDLSNKVLADLVDLPNPQAQTDSQAVANGMAAFLRQTVL